MHKIGIAIILVFTFACGHNDTKESGSNSSSTTHEEPVFQSTLFTNNTEFYVEYDPLVVGEESHFLVHVTNLNDYNPYMEGELTISINGVSKKTEKPDRPGIFQLHFRPDKIGDFNINYTLKSGAEIESVTDQVMVLEDHEAIHQNEQELVLGDIQFLKETAWKVDFFVKEVQSAPFSSIVLTSGELIPMPGMKRNIPANAMGIVNFSKNDLVQGSNVSKGQLLFTISGKTLTEDNVGLLYQDYQNQLKKSRSEYERYRVLLANEVISERQYIEVRTKFISDSLRFHNLAKTASREGLKVYAPISGYIHELNISEGQYVERGQLMVTISSNETLLLRADIPQQYYYLLNDFETANFRPAYSLRTYSIEELNGKLLAKGSSVAENEHYLPLYFKLINNGDLLEGAFAEIYLKTAEKEQSLTVPLSAISEEQGAHYLYLQITGESFFKRQVALGESDGVNVKITKGLKHGERVVTQGVMLLKAASMATGVPTHDHEH